MLRFNLRFLFALFVVVGVVCAVWAGPLVQRWRQQRIADEMIAGGVRVFRGSTAEVLLGLPDAAPKDYLEDWPPASVGDPRGPIMMAAFHIQAPADRSLLKKLGCFDQLEILTVSWRGKPLADDLTSLAYLPRLRGLYLDCADLPDGLLMPLTNCKSLREVEIETSHVSGSALRRLGALPNLKVLRIHGATVSDTALESLTTLASVDRITFIDSQVSKAKLEEIAPKLPHTAIRWDTIIVSSVWDEFPETKWEEYRQALWYDKPDIEHRPENWEQLRFADLSKFIEANPNFTAALERRAYHRETDDQAIADFTTAIKIEPHEPGPYYDRGIIFFQLEDDAQALYDFTQFVRYSDPPCPARHRIRQAQALRDLGRYEEAIEEYRVVAATGRWEYGDFDTIALSWLATLWSAAPDADVRDIAAAQAALKLLEQWAPRDVERSYYSEITAIVMAELGRFDEAVARQKKANRLYQDEDNEISSEAHRRLELYQNRQPFRLPTRDEIELKRHE